MAHHDIENLLTIIRRIDDRIMFTGSREPSLGDVAEVWALFAGTDEWIRTAAAAAQGRHHETGSPRVMLLAMRCAAVGAAMGVKYGDKAFWTDAMEEAFALHQRCSHVQGIYHQRFLDGDGLLCEAVYDSMEHCERIEDGLTGLGRDVWGVTKMRIAVDHMISAWVGLGTKIRPELCILPSAIQMLAAVIEEVEAVGCSPHDITDQIDCSGSAWGI